jgi:adenosylhomocysteine nucleosidase
MNYIIVTALQDESLGLEKFAPVIHTGIGKVNACIHLYEAIVKYQPDVVINYGTAGGLSDLSGLHKISHFIQIDMDVRALDFPRGITPLMGETFPLVSGLVLGTSDSFITNANKQLEGLKINIDLVDMEAYALNKVCKHHKIDFISYKYISDNANENAGTQWQDTVSDGTHLFAQLLATEYGKSEIKIRETL